MGNEEKICKVYLLLKDYPSFNLEKAVCNHGFFMMAPNVWDPITKSLNRPLRLYDNLASVNVTISKPPEYNFLLIQVHGVDNLSYADKEAILGQVSRMMRLSTKNENDVQQFQKIHPEAKNVGFGRIFRSPSLFEDAVKTILLCFCNWENSLRMARNLCQLQLELSIGLIKVAKPDPQSQKGGYKKRKHDSSSSSSTQTKTIQQSVGNFPSAEELASVDLEILEYHCSMGFRASQVHKFAKDVISGKCKLSHFETYESQKELHKKLMKINGFGYFVSANISMCLGFYGKVPADTETIRHLKEVHKRKKCTKKNFRSMAEAVYKEYAPYQCLAYWFELAKYYEQKLGKLSELPSSRYGSVSGSQYGSTINTD
ncbi:OLC1v1018577C1 [Oldenlandia corymbosa var. corymbosa]|uniref:OLC1v1018577C1 n=1 Tax=Oldenlandia corymbosa var. corymbosa TaxID=529605 RepID=A0AAV1EBX7_OLDCO|nr:OLC1v1018577C1 [Oldenlandia corymbosa var. corymbosa]